MKLKVTPEDFIVRELIDLPLSPKGRYTLLRLEKRFWNTLDVIRHLAGLLSVAVVSILTSLLAARVAAALNVGTLSIQLICFISLLKLFFFSFC